MTWSRRDAYEKQVREFSDEELVERIEWFHQNFDGANDRICGLEILRRFKERIAAKV